MTVNQMATLGSAYRNMNVNYTSAVKSMRNLSTGYRINSAADDAAGLAVSEKMRGQIGGLSKAGENVQEGMNLLQTADGHLESATNILRRMEELAVQGSNGLLTGTDRQAVAMEFNQLKEELGSLVSKSDYNGHKLLDGSLDMYLQVGANGTKDQQMHVAIGNMSLDVLGLDKSNIDSADAAVKALDAIKGARETVLLERANIGAKESRLEYTLNNIGVTKENLVASESRIRDTDMAQEIMNYTSSMIQAQASQAMMAQSMNLSRQYMLGILMMR